MRIPKKRKDETLHEWTSRLAEDVPIRKLDDENLKELLHEISIQSYIQGSNAMSESIVATINNRRYDIP